MLDTELKNEDIFINMKQPIKPKKPLKYFGGEELGRIEISSNQKLENLDLEQYDYYIEIEDNYYLVTYLVQKTKLVENLNYQQELEKYESDLFKYKIAKKEWDQKEKERRSAEKSKKAEILKNAEYKLFLKLKKKYSKNDWL